MKIRQDPRWPYAHLRLKQLYLERVRVSQEEFGKQAGFGGQALVWQYLNGYIPLGYEAAAKFARALNCTIADISPEMDLCLRSSILPAMGLARWPRLRRVAVALAALTLLGPGLVKRTEAATVPIYVNAVHYVKSFFRRWLSRSRWSKVHQLLHH